MLRAPGLAVSTLGLGEAMGICFVLRLCKFELWRVSGIDNQARRFLTLSARTIFFKACVMPTLKAGLRVARRTLGAASRRVHGLRN